MPAVTIVHRDEQFSAADALQRRLRTRTNVSILMQHTVEDFVGGEMRSQVLVKDLASHRTETLDARGAFVCIGPLPHTAPFADALARDEDHRIKVNLNMATSMPNVYGPEW
jgi:thioredoxin reductase (NADPH)